MADYHKDEKISEPSSWYLKTVETRQKFLLQRLGREFFDKKSALELGANLGHFGDWMHNLGADVTCADLVEERVKHIRTHKPHLKAVQLDIEKGITGQWDIITHLRILHHLNDPEFALRDACKHTQFLILEARVLDSSDMYLIKPRGEKFPGTMVVSGPFVERVLREEGFTVARFDEGCHNIKHRWYNWEIRETGELPRGYARMWVAMRDPFKDMI